MIWVRVLIPSFFIAVANAFAAEPVPADHAAKMTESQQLFKEKVRPFLVSQCLDCHGGSKTKSGFSLATRELLLKGGDRGVAIAIGKGRESLLVRSVAREDEPHMPPKKPAPKDAIEFLTKWIDLGAAYDKPLIEAVERGTKKPLVVSEKDKDYWAYRSLQKTAPPAVKNIKWVRNPVDRFILAKLEAKGITPAEGADRRTLIRRVTFDLIGLPPTPEDVEAFVQNNSPDAYEKVVDRLLASPHFGERWARHWLDPARFAESHGFEHDYLRPFAYHYRDFVIKALNADMPYDQFVRWQIAGDELAPNDPQALAATGFLGAGVYPTQITTTEAERVRYDAMDDMLGTTGHTFLALTVGCARCHDHKYDPIPTRDYYRMLSAFTTTVRSEVEWDFGTPAEKAATAAFEAKLKPFSDELKRYEQNDLPEQLTEWIAERKAEMKDPPKVAEPRAAAVLKMLWAGRKSYKNLPDTHKVAIVKWFGPQDAGWKERQAKIAAMEKGRPKNTKTKIQVCSEGVKPMRHHTAVESIPDFYPTTFILNRGDVAQKNAPATLGFLQVLTRNANSEEHWLAAPQNGSKTSFRRTTLTNWLIDPDHGAGALAARVMVNRLWHHHFGRGIVSTVNDFGFQGDPPTHPELLEWLANDFISHGWSLKRMHKQIVMSRVYQLSGKATDSGKTLDVDNRLWHHHPRRRLETEAIRDALLAVGGKLDATMYGPGTLDTGMTRRSIYFTVKRSQLIPMLQVFDWPDTLTSAAARPTTVIAPQALLFLNNPQVRDWAKGFAERLKVEESRGHETVVKRAYQIAFGRPPTPEEVKEGTSFLLKGTLSDYALALMSLNEFIYVD